MLREPGEHGEHVRADVERAKLETTAPVASWRPEIGARI